MRRPRSRTLGAELELELELKPIQTRIIQKPLPWVEAGKVLVCVLGIPSGDLRVVPLSFRLLDMTRGAPHFWAFSLGVWSAS